MVLQLARKQKLNIKKLKKKVFKTHNIKLFQQYNYNFSLIFQINTSISELVKSLKLILSKKTNFAYFFFKCYLKRYINIYFIIMKTLINSINKNIKRFDQIY